MKGLMDKYVIKRPRFHVRNQAPTLDSVVDTNFNASGSGFGPKTAIVKKSNIEFNLNEIISNPGRRIHIDSYDVNIREQVCRAYLINGNYQPSNYIFLEN